MNASHILLTFDMAIVDALASTVSDAFCEFAGSVSRYIVFVTSSSLGKCKHPDYQSAKSGLPQLTQEYIDVIHFPDLSQRLNVMHELFRHVIV